MRHTDTKCGCCWMSFPSLPRRRCSLSKAERRSISSSVIFPGSPSTLTSPICHSTHEMPPWPRSPKRCSGSGPASRRPSPRPGSRSSSSQAASKPSCTASVAAFRSRSKSIQRFAVISCRRGSCPVRPACRTSLKCLWRPPSFPTANCSAGRSAPRSTASILATCSMCTCFSTPKVSPTRSGSAFSPP